MRNKAQVSLFIVLVTVLIVISAIVFLQKKLPKTEQTLELDDASLPLRAYVEQCLEKVGEEAIFFTGLQGGFYSLDSGEFLPYYFFNNQSMMPSQKEIEGQLATYVDSQLLFCLKNFREFRSQGMQVEFETPVSDALIRDNDILFEVSMPIVLKKSGSQALLKQFSARVPSHRLKNMLDGLKSYLDAQTSFHEFCVDCMVDMALDHDLFITILPQGTDLLFVVEDKNVQFQGQTLIYDFLMKFDSVSCENIPLYLEEDEKIKIVSECLNQKVQNAKR